MDKFESLQAFIEVARQGGFSKAAHELGIPVPTISRRVADLEASLGVRLFQRSTRRVILTESGADYYVSCRRVLEALREADEQVSGAYSSPQGELSITAPLGFGRQHLQPVATEFLRAHPHIDLRLILVDRLVNMVDEHVDLALRISELPDSTMVARAVGAIKMVVCASPTYLRRKGKPTHPGQLLDHDCISWTSLGPIKTWLFSEEGRERMYPIRARISTSTPDSAVLAARDGMGLAQVTTYQAAELVETGKLVTVLRDFEAKPTPVSLVYPSKRTVPMKLRAFLDFAAPRLTARLNDIAKIGF